MAQKGEPAGRTICWKVDREARMEPPIQTEYLRSGGATTLTFMEEGARAVISLFIRSAMPGNMVVPVSPTRILWHLADSGTRVEEEMYTVTRQRAWIQPSCMLRTWQNARMKSASQVRNCMAKPPHLGGDHRNYWHCENDPWHLIWAHESSRGTTASSQCRKAARGGRTSREDHVAVKVLTDVDIALHDGVEGGLIDASRLHAHHGRREQHLRAPEALAADGDHLRRPANLRFLDHLICAHMLHTSYCWELRVNTWLQLQTHDTNYWSNNLAQDNTQLRGTPN